MITDEDLETSNFYPRLLRYNSSYKNELIDRTLDKINSKNEDFDMRFIDEVALFIIRMIRMSYDGLPSDEQFDIEFEKYL
jgi:hypothetical protein